ncbi:hypothetical protein PHYPSEUDO_012352 [Phytophthora pseudosyringae]|uniref:Uncharacterized protein n=1 Tax=Phytophthora pseudosyringae TaxID=221518 RepID=A0A8T1V6T4_9STRA|nr:hypothetical protein PHYPSEUDO_012352 [Phytophthora pseudosyringae]
MDGQHGVTGGVAPEQRSGPYQHFCILNENVFELILSFLGNQALTKLHAITGDNYPNCEPDLAPFCCDCGNDNPKMFDGICRECESKVDGYTPFIQKETATSRYGLKIRDLVAIPQYPRDGHQDATLYHRVDLENYLIAKCGSKMTWLREIAQRYMVENAIEAMQEQEREERQVFMESLAPGFAIYAQLIDLEETNTSLLWQCSQRFTALTTELKSRGLQLRPESKLCEQFVVSGDGPISHVVDTLEERRFLNGCTDYPRRWERKFENAQHGNETKHGFREEAKMELCIAYLENHRGLKLPRKWENCRSRFEEVQRTGGTPLCEVRYIYSES